MIKRHFKIRVFLLMLALGLASVPFFKSLYSEFVVASINLPEINSNSPLIISPETKNFTSCCGGGSGPHGPSEPLVTVNTLGIKAKSHIIENADIQGIKLPNADLTEAKIENSVFSYANLRKANFSKASVIYSSFISTNLRNVNFTEAKLFGSDLTDADLFGAKLKRANFAASGFSNANLKNADLTDTNLSNAKLESAKGLNYEQLSKAIINEFTTLPAKFKSKNSILLALSRQRMKELRKQMSAKELDLFTNEFDFLD